MVVATDPLFHMMLSLAKIFLPCVSDIKGSHRVEKATFNGVDAYYSRMLSSARWDASLLGKSADWSSLRTVEQRSSAPFSLMLGPVFGSPPS